MAENYLGKWQKIIFNKNMRGKKIINKTKQQIINFG